jgi:hypothetical protein
MTVIFQVDSMSELDEISHWLSQKKIVIEKKSNQKINADELLKRLNRFKINLPSDYKFNREEANER